MFLCFSAAALFLCLVYQSVAIKYPYSLDYGEAPLVDQAMRLVAGQNIYRADISTPPYTISNYPPLYVALIAFSVKLFGASQSFFIGRIISALSALAASVFIALIVYAATQDRFAAISAGVIFLAFPFVVVWSPLLRIDMFALALSLAGLCLLIWSPTSPRRFVTAALLLVAAIYTRQSYALAAPLAGFVWLLARDWKQALHFSVLVGGLALALFFILNQLTRGGFFFNIVTANVNEFKIDQLIYHWNRLRDAALIPLLIGAASLFLIRRWNPLWTLAAPYLFGSALSAATIGKIGSNVNYLLELSAALSLGAGIVIAWSRAHLPFHTLRAALLVMIALGVGKMIHVTLTDYTGDLRARRASVKELSDLEAIVVETPGPILADEYMGMLTLHGRQLVIQPFEVTQLARAGKWDQTPLLESINKKEFSSIILYDRPWSNERWTPEMLNAINHSYRLVDVIAENKVYKAFQQTSSASPDTCPDAGWRLPSDGSRGVQIQDNGINFFGQGSERKIPVYAVADGLLMRRNDWIDAVAIQHDDPLHPSTRVWSYYSGMAAANGIDSYVADEFSSGSINVPVKAGQVIGYQGTWSGKPLWGKWIHVHFGVVRADGQGTFPEEVTNDQFLDPAPYLGIILEDRNENAQLLKCN